jgi:hypothetical protein
LQITHRTGSKPYEQPGRYTTQWTGIYIPELWYRYMIESDNYHGGTFTRWIAALSAATYNVQGLIISRNERPTSNYY